MNTTESIKAVQVQNTAFGSTETNNKVTNSSTQTTLNFTEIDNLQATFRHLNDFKNELFSDVLEKNKHLLSILKPEESEVSLLGVKREKPTLIQKIHIEKKKKQKIKVISLVDKIRKKRHKGRFNGFDIFIKEIKDSLRLIPEERQDEVVA